MHILRYEDSFVLIWIAGGGVIEFSLDLACKYPGAFFSYFSFTGHKLVSEGKMEAVDSRARGG